MRLHWKLIAIELFLQIVLECGPASFNLMATVTEYLVELSREASRASVQLIVSSIGHSNARRGPVMDLEQYTFSGLTHRAYIL